MSPQNLCVDVHVAFDAVDSVLLRLCARAEQKDVEAFVAGIVRKTLRDLCAGLREDGGMASTVRMLTEVGRA